MQNAKTLSGEEMIVLTRAEYEALVEDAGDAALASEARGGPVLPAELALAVAEGQLHPLAAWRGVAGLTQAALAARAGLRSASVSDIEGGKSDPRLSTLTALATVLGLEVADLVP